ncbi:hypothetical protein [Hymenobacter roseosalivarius]|nr:hypothetical protein [Hymenobacter roseosalivarius]
MKVTETGPLTDAARALAAELVLVMVGCAPTGWDSSRGPASSK